MNDRMCIVTRHTGSVDDLIRFVLGPDQQVVPDLKRKLPGRGCWVTAERQVLEKAISKNHFSRGLKAKAIVSSDLADTVDLLLGRDLLGMIGMARKAGQIVSGATKVDQAVRSTDAIAVFHALDASADGVRKIDKARKWRQFTFDDDEEIPAFRLFSAHEMENLLGLDNLIHLAALAGQAGEGVVKRAMMLSRYRNGAGAKQGGARTVTDELNEADETTLYRVASDFEGTDTE